VIASGQSCGFGVDGSFVPWISEGSFIQMSDIILSPGARDSIRNLSDFDKLLARTQQRLTTSKRVNSVLDDASAFFTSRDLGSLATSYDSYINTTRRAIDLVQITADTADAVARLLEQQLSVVRSAQATPSQRAGAEGSLQTIKTQINLLILDAEFRGQNLLSATSTRSYSYRIGGTTGAILTLTGRQFRSDETGEGIYTGIGGGGFSADTAVALREALGYTAAGFNHSLFTAVPAAFTSIIARLEGAVTRVRAAAQSYGVSVSVLEIRAEFNDKIKATSSKASERLVAADLNEEGANLVTLQTRRELGLEALAAEGRNVRAILTLLR
jgi:flagellin-like hook-associated protein FlgL